jgi:hypothetical protein
VPGKGRERVGAAALSSKGAGERGARSKQLQASARSVVPSQQHGGAFIAAQWGWGWEAQGRPVFGIASPSMPASASEA